MTGRGGFVAGLLLTALAGQVPVLAQPEDPGPLALAATAARRALADAGFESTELRVEGRRLVAWRGGAGPDLVLLHGAGQQAGAWVAVAPGLAADHTVHVLDLPGHGDSEPLEGPLFMAEIVGGLEGYLATLSEPAILVGNSMGAWLATIAAHRHPERVARAVLVNGGALLNVPAEGLTLMPSDREAARRVMAALRDPSSPQLPDPVLDDIVKRSNTGPIARMMQDTAGLMGHLLEGRLHEVTVPVDILWGTSDRLIPIDYALRMERQLPRARLTELERCGHIPTAECPERLLEALRGLLDSPPPEGSAASSEPEGTADESSRSGPGEAL